MTLEVCWELAVIHQMHADLVRETQRSDALLCKVLLLYREGESVYSASELRSLLTGFSPQTSMCCIQTHLDCHSAPTGTKLQESVSGTHSCFVEEVMNLVELRFLKVV